MALTISKTSEGKKGMQQTDRRLFFNEDKTELLNEGDEGARFLACGPGDDVPEGFDMPDAPEEVEDDGPDGSPSIGHDPDRSDYEGMRVGDLKDLIDSRGLDRTGKSRKDEFIDVLDEADKAAADDDA